MSTTNFRQLFEAQPTISMKQPLAMRVNSTVSMKQLLGMKPSKKISVVTPCAGQVDFTVRDFAAETELFSRIQHKQFPSKYDTCLTVVDMLWLDREGAWVSAFVVQWDHLHGTTCYTSDWGLPTSEENFVEYLCHAINGVIPYADVCLTA